MKKTLMTRALLAAMLFVTLFTFAACEKDGDEPDNTSDFVATLNGEQETPSVAVAGTGTFTATYNSSTHLLSYTLTWTALTGAPTGMHFHSAPVGVAGDVVVPITGYTAAAAGTLTATATIDEAAEADLLGGLFYVNIHTEQYPAGEIRGQVLVQ